MIDKGKWEGIKYNFVIYKNRESDKIFSTVLFFRSEKRDKYTKSLIQIVKDVKTLFPEYNLRIYCDKTSLDFVRQFIKELHVEIFVYYFPDFFDTKMDKHNGLFGTLIRYLPLFDFPNHQAKQTIIFDVDSIMRGKVLTAITYFDQHPEEKLMYRSRFCYDMVPRLQLIGNNLKYYIISSYLAQRGNLPQKIFIDFLTNCLIKNCDNYKYLLNTLDKSSTNDIYSKQNKIDGKYRYGIDEYFLNTSYLQYYIDQKINFIIFVPHSDITDTLGYYLKSLNNTSQQKPTIKEFIELLMNDQKLNKSASLLNSLTKPKVLSKNKKIHPQIYNIKKLSNFLTTHTAVDLDMDPRAYQCIIQNISLDKASPNLFKISPNSEPQKILLNGFG